MAKPVFWFQKLEYWEYINYDVTCKCKEKLVILLLFFFSIIFIKIEKKSQLGQILHQGVV